MPAAAPRVGGRESGSGTPAPPGRAMSRRTCADGAGDRARSALEAPRGATSPKTVAQRDGAAGHGPAAVADRPAERRFFRGAERSTTADRRRRPCHRRRGNDCHVGLPRGVPARHARRPGRVARRSRNSPGADVPRCRAEHRSGRRPTASRGTASRGRCGHRRGSLRLGRRATLRRRAGRRCPVRSARENRRGRSARPPRRGRSRETS